MRILQDATGSWHPELKEKPDVLNAIGAEGTDYGFVIDSAVCDPELAARHQEAIEEGNTSPLRHQLIDAFYEIGKRDA